MRHKKKNEMYNPSNFPLCEKDIERVNKKFVDQGWITLYEERAYATMVSDAVLEEALEGDTWELRPDEARPFINESHDSVWGYSKLYHDGIEPIVVLQEEKGHHKEQIRLCEEMVLFYDLRIIDNQDGDFDYVMVDEAGDDVVIARYEKGSLTALVKYVKEFIAVKGMNLLVQFDIMNYNAKHLDELGASVRELTYYKDVDSILSYSLNESAGMIEDYNAVGMIMGKVAFRHNEADIKLLWHGHEDGFEVFIVGQDDNGDDITSTCDDSKLPNMFTRKGDEVYSLTPAYFKRVVLKKYYDDNVKFTVQDGYISGPTWGIHADTDRSDNLVAVTLVDLGRLPHKEQVYWKSFNVVPPKGAKLSETTWTRWIAGMPCNTQNSLDFIFKQEYLKKNKAWEKHYGWPLFKPLAKGDEYRFESLHVMTARNNDVEFHDLLQSLTLLVVDSLNEKEIGKGIDITNSDVAAFMSEKGFSDLKDVKGISKFELFLIGAGKRNDAFVKFLRNLQDLRSTNVAHRKSSNPNKREKDVIEWCGLDKQSQQQVFNQLLTWLINGLKSI